MTEQWLHDRLEDGSVQMDSHEGELRDLLNDVFPDGGVLVDIGANMGLWTVRLGAKASRVIAVEPNRACADVLRQNIALNGLGGVAEVLEVAAWDCDEPLGFLNPSLSGDPLSGLMRVVPGYGGPIRGTRLDDALPSLERLDLVKVDVEGADIRALRGMSGTIARHRPALFIESHHHLPGAPYTFEELGEFVSSLGYMHEEHRWVSQYHLLCKPQEMPVRHE